MDVRKIKKIMELVESHGITEIEISDGDQSIRMSRLTGVPAVQPPAAAHGTVHLTDPSAADRKEPVPAETATGHEVTSPMVGTFYAGPARVPSPLSTWGPGLKWATRCASSKR